MATTENETKKTRKRNHDKRKGGADGPPECKLRIKGKKTKDKAEEILALDVSKQQEFENKVANLPTGVKDDLTPGVIHIKHLPHGFYEDELRGYFSQFGTVTRLIVPRSRKTAGAKGYAFVEFACDEVAKVAASAMDNYLMFDKLLKCRFVPPEQVGDKMFKNCNKKFYKINWQKRERHKQNRVKSKKEYSKQLLRLAKKDSKMRKKLKELGIDYKFPGYMSKVAKENKTEAEETKVTIAAPNPGD